MSFLKDRVFSEGYTFDDVLLMPSYSEILPKEVNLETRFSRNIKLNIPIVSAAMDTVTEATLAMAIAREGGIGVLHKNMSIEEQVRQVLKIKRSESGMIKDPVTITGDAVVLDALTIMKTHKIGGIPVIDEYNKLIGIVTNRDLRFEKNMQKRISEVMTKDNLVTAKGGTNLIEAEEILQKYKIEKLPVVNENNELIGLITLKDILKVRQFPNACKDSQGRLRVAAAIGVGKNSEERIDALIKASVDALVLDSAHGHSKLIIDLLKLIKKNYPNTEVVVGNIATAEAAIDLANAGADAIKVGIGPGSICTTRIIAGVGVPQLSAIYDVASALKDYDVPVIADGGTRYSGDIVKALSAGASSVMIGSMLAGVEESPGEAIIYEGRKFKNYRGMGSIEAMQKGSKDRYGQDDENDVKKLVPEGIVGRVPYKGFLSEVIYQILGGLRAGMGYCGAKNIQELKKARFIKISIAGINESHPHNVTITREAPNYSR